LGDTTNAQTGFLPAQPPVPFTSVATAIRSLCRKAEECEPNVQVAEGLYEFVQSHGLKARTYEMRPLTLAGGIKLAYWHSLLLIEDEKVTVPFFDPRRTTTKLTPLARRFVFSAMHERLRVLDTDLAGAQLAIFQFSTADDGPRQPRRFDEERNLFTFAELDSMVRETYEIWNGVYTRRVERERRRGKG
jgi:hypothetical protein